MKTNMSPVYAAVLILNPCNYTRYIETHWPKKWAKPILVKIKKLWEKYKKKKVFPVSVITLFSYGIPFQKLLKLDVFDRITLSFRSIARPVSENEYEDYNSQESYDPGKKKTLTW